MWNLYDCLQEDEIFPGVLIQLFQVAGFVVSAIECAVAPGDIDDNQTVKSFEYYATDTTQKRQMKALESFLGQTFAKGDLFNKFR